MASMRKLIVTILFIIHGTQLFANTTEIMQKLELPNYDNLAR